MKAHHPGIGTLHLTPEIRDTWKVRTAVETIKRRMPDGSITTSRAPRIGAVTIKTAARALYLDIAQWALDEPARWGPSPIPPTEADCFAKKIEQEAKARADARTRERLPLLPAFMQVAARRPREAKARLEALEAAPLGGTITVLGETFTVPRSGHRADGKPSHASDSNGNRRDIRSDEKPAFHGWATVEILRPTGIRVEELKELGHHSIISYKPPTTGEVVPLLRIAPSKTDQEACR
ncbi:hypothetical protein [Kitasatospora sp. GP82]|uniref:hypothetical protein n=1 Tax=Kitasatospora sp. GP82 TaxID=3035089 RepID=UPI0024750CEF|nr:hypothetical protein [Kitasatospora sp. GP82]MDH6127386.1 hypothetical protein [Kitasatospora sp. GP82]